MALDPYELALRRRLGLPEEEDTGEGTDWFQPIRTAFGFTQGVVPRALSFLFPETYQQAVEENRQTFGVGPDASTAEQVEAAPGAGDVLAQVVPEGVSESLVGRMVGPAARMVGNIAGDPTTYTPWIMAKAGRGIAALAKGGKAAMAVSAMETASKAEEAARALELGQISRDVSILARETAAAQEMTRVAQRIAATGGVQGKVAASAIRAGQIIAAAEPYAMGTAAAVAYGPGVVKSGLGSLGETYEAVKEGDVEQALVSGANSVLMGGLGYLMGRGLISATKAREVLRKKLVEDGVLPDIDKMVREQAGAMRAEGEPGGDIMPTSELEALQREVRGAGVPLRPSMRGEPAPGPMPPPLLDIKRAEPTGQVGFRGEVPLAPDIAALQAEVAGAEAPLRPSMRGEPMPGPRPPGPSPAEMPSGFRGRTLVEPDVENLLRATEEARARALEARARATQEGAAFLPDELATRMDERLAGTDLEPPVRFPEPAPQMVIPGMAEPAPIARPVEPPARRPRPKGKQPELPVMGEGETITRPPTAAERAAERKRVEDAKVNEAFDLAMQDADVVTRVERETRAGMLRDLEDLARSRTGQKGLAAERKLFESGNTPEKHRVAMNNPEYANWYNSHRAAAIERLKGEFRRQVKGGLDPAEMLRAKRIDAEERAAIQGEGEPTPAPEAPVAEVAPAEPTTPPRTPPSEPAVVAEPLVTPPAAAPVVEPPAAPPRAAPAEPTVPPEPTMAGGRTPREWMESAVRNKLFVHVKDPAERAKLAKQFVDDNPGLMDEFDKGRGKIPEDQLGNENTVRASAYRALYDFRDAQKKREVTEQLAEETGAPTEVTRAEAREASLHPPGGRSPSGVEGMEKGNLATTTVTTEGAGGPSRAAAAREAKGTGLTLTEGQQKWLVVHRTKKEHGLTTVDLLEPHLGEYLPKSPGGKKKLSKESATRFANYTRQFDALVADKMDPKKARAQAIEASRGDLSVRSWQNEVHWIEDYLTEKHFDEVAKGAGLKPEALAPGESPVAKAARTVEEFEALGKEAEKIVLDPEYDATLPQNKTALAALLNRFNVLAPENLGSSALGKRFSEAAKNLRQLGRDLFPDDPYLRNPKKGVRDIAEHLARKLGIKLEAPVSAERVERQPKPAPPAEVKPSAGFEKGAEWGAGKIAKGPGQSRVRFNRHPAEGSKLLVEVLDAKSVDGLRQDVAALVADPNVGDIVFDASKPDGVSQRDWNKAVEQLQREQGLVQVDPSDVAEMKAKGILKQSVENEDVLRVNRSTKTSKLEVQEASERAHRPDERLRASELREREAEYTRQEEEAVGEVVDHDGYNGRVYSARVQKILGKAIGGMREVFDDLVREIAPKTKVRFAGITTSPYLRGLFREEGGQRARVYANVMEAVANSKNYDEAVEGLAYTMAHEVAHLAGEAHDSMHFANTNEYLQNIVKVDDWRAKATEKLKKAGFDEAMYRKVKEQLADEFVEARKEINARRRGEAAVEGGPARTAQGRAATQPDLAARGAEAAAGDQGGGVRPGEAVSGSSGGQAGDVRPGTPDSDRVARRLAEGEAAGPYARGGSDPIESVIAALEARDPTERLKYEEAVRTLDGMVKTKSLGVDEVHSVAMRLAKELADVATDAEIKDLLNRAPEPRGRTTAQGPVDWGPINFLREIPNMPERSKARGQIYALLLSDAGVPASGKPRPWHKVNQEVRDLLGLKTKEQYLKMFGHKGGGMTDTDVVLLETINDEFVRETDRLMEKFKAAAEKGDPIAEAEAYKEYRTAADNEALAIKLTIEKKSQVARALAVMRQKGLEMDPKAQFNTSLRAFVSDRLGLRIKDKVLRDAKTEELMKAWEDQRARGAPLQEFFDMLDHYTGRTGLRGIGYKALEFWKAGLLGWPSEFANISSNAIFRGSRFLEDTLAAGLDAGLFKTGLTKERSVWLGERKVAGRAMRRALVEGMGPLLESQLKLFRLEGSDLEKMLESGSAIQDLMMGGGGAIPGKMGNFIRFHFGMMQNFDTYFKLLSKYDTLYREVYRGLRKGEGWLKKMERPGEKIEDAVERIVGELRRNQDNWRNGLQHDGPMLFHSKGLFEKAQRIAERDTFQKELGAKGRAIQSFLTEHPWSQLFVPFFRTPTNIVKEALKRTPLGFLDVLTPDAWKKLELEGGQAAQMQELAKPVLGSSVMALFAMLAANGEVTGGGPLSFEEREALQATGWQPYSIRIGDQWISYQRFEPIASILGMAADMMEAHRAGDLTTDDLARAAQKVSDSIAENLTNKTFLSGLSTLTGAISDPKRELGTFVKQMQASLVPNSIGFVPFGHLARAIDPVYREAEPFSKEALLSKIPFVSTTLDPAYGPTGEPRTRPGGFVERLISPVARRTVQSGPHSRGSEEIVRVQAVPKAPIRYWTSPQGFRVPLKPEERQRVAKAMQEAVTEIGQRIVNDPWYQSLPKDEMDPNYQYGQKTKQKVLEKVIDRYRNRAMQQIKPALKQRSRQAYEEREL